MRRLARFPGLVLAALLLLPVGAFAAGGNGEELRVSPDLHEILQLGESGLTYEVMLIIYQFAAMLLAAKVLGWLAEKVKIPGVIGELMAGVLIGPFLLGSILKVPLHGYWVALFPAPTQPGQWPVNPIMWSFAQFASIVLLFMAGLHTDLKQFLRYVGPATLVAVVGLVAPFGLGAAVVYIPMFSEIAAGPDGGSVLIPALFVGAILAATSIGITARVLGDIDKLDTPEGVTILGAAVLDDVLGIIALAIVGGMAAAGSISLPTIGGIAGKAFGFWIGLTLISFLLARPIERLIGKIRYAGAMVGIGLALAFLASAAAEGFGLAFIIGAYSVGLGLSRTKMAEKLLEELQPVANFIVPIFFATLGMLVDLQLMFADWRVVAFGLAVTAVAIIGKLLGCGMAAYATGFNGRGSYRIGLGMLPRGEVALIVAGIGLSRQIIDQNVFGVSLMMTLITTVVAPILLVPAFAKGGYGRRSATPQPKLPPRSDLPAVAASIPADLAGPVLQRLLQIAEARGWDVNYRAGEDGDYLLRSQGDAAQVSLTDGHLKADAGARRKEFEQMLSEALASARSDLSAVSVSDATPD